jgi:diketogulonate reductase-like aldo/keto reductase
MIQRVIPATGESLPVIGMGTWQTFNVSNETDYPVLKDVLNTLHEGGGRLIDSSPMYGWSEKVVGDISASTSHTNDFFYATKLWTTGLQEGIQQMKSSVKKMKRITMDLVQIHNLTDWKTHLPQLRKMKEEGSLRYIGITHYLDSSHEELEKVIVAEKPDFVQFNYSIISRNAEKRLLKAAADNAVATIINRPFGQGNLFSLVQGKPLPAWAQDLGMNSWPAFFLKYIIANEAVTCVIPASSSVAHTRENMLAGGGDLPNDAVREKMVAYLEAL